MSLRGALLCLLVVVGCGGRPALPKLPSQGGPPWRELQTENFTMWTNASSERGHELLRLIEERRQVVSRAMNRTQQKGRVFVIALRSYAELAAFQPPPVAAFAWPSWNPSYQPGIALFAERDPATEALVNHELAHAISHSLVKYQPRWLAEGLATFFTLGALNPETNEVRLGVLAPALMQKLQRSGPLPTGKLFSCKSQECSHDEMFYASSWALFSHLIQERDREFGGYLQQLKEHRGDHDKAWRAAFPQLPAEKLDGVLSGWFYEGKFPVVSVEVELRSYPVVERALGEADALATFSLLSFLTGQPEAANAQAKAALAVDRTHPLAWQMAMVEMKRPIELDDARAVVKAHPQSWRAWQLLMFSLQEAKGEGDAEAKAAGDRMCALAQAEGLDC